MRIARTVNSVFQEFVNYKVQSIASDGSCIYTTSVSGTSIVNGTTVSNSQDTKVYNPSSN